VNLYLFGKDREIGGVRTAIEVSPVRVYPDRGAETGQTRLRGGGEIILVMGAKICDNS